MRLFTCSFYAEEERESKGGRYKFGKEKGNQESMHWDWYRDYVFMMQPGVQK